MIGNEYDFLLERYTGDPKTKLLSICIPVYKEDGYLQYTLKHLMGQRMFQNGYIQIVIGEYKDNYADNSIKNLCESLGPNVKYVHIPKKGISHARNICVLNSVNPIWSDNAMRDKDKRILGYTPIPFLMNMDADARFQFDTGTYYMLLPLLEKPNLMLTNCRIIYPSDIRKRKEKENKTLAEYIFQMASDLGTASEKVFTARGPGMTFRREAFDRVGGFREDKKVAEDYWFALDVCYNYTIQAKDFMDNVNIIASDRRVKGANKDGLLKAFNYEKSNYR